MSAESRRDAGGVELALRRDTVALYLLIGVNQGMLVGALSHGHQECVQYEALSHRRLGGPVDNPAGMQVHYDGQISLE